MFGIVDNKISLGKESIFPFAAEVHYFRLDKRYWSICFERIKRAKIRLITTPVPWNLHQNRNRDIDFSGFHDSRKDLIVFLELARELGFKVILRPGPYIGADWANGGIPEFVTSDLRSLARNHEDNEIPLPGLYGAKGGYLVSYMNSAFQNSMRHYFKSFVEITKNYIHPRGPVVIVELDCAPAFGGELDPASSDYNSDTLSKFLGPFLLDRYEDIKKLNSVYKTRYKSFDDVEPPRKFENVSQKNLPAFLDWFRFKESMLNQYFESLESIYENYTVRPILLRSHHFAPKSLVPEYQITKREEGILVGSHVLSSGAYTDISKHGRYLRGSGIFSWSSSFPSGRGAEDPEHGEKLEPVTTGERRFLPTASLASGFRGFNLRMFVDHENWFGAPLKHDGSVSSGYEIMKRVVESADRTELASLNADVQIAVVGNRKYQWFGRLTHPKEFHYLPRLVNESLTGLCGDLTRLKLDYDICESNESSQLTNYKLVIVPSAEFMSESEQQAIIDLTDAGVSILMFGVLPKLDENMVSCTILANQFHFKTSLVESISEIKSKDSKFTSYVYSQIKTTDSKLRRIAQADKNLVGITSHKHKGQFTFFGLDISSGFDHHKLTFLESFLFSQGIEPVSYCSDPLVDIVVHHTDKLAVIYLAAPPTGQLTERVETHDRDVFFRVDLKKIGLKFPKIKVTDILESEEIPALKITSAALASGIEIRISYPDGKILLVEKRK